MSALFIRKSVLGLAAAVLFGLAGAANAEGFRPTPPPIRPAGSAAAAAVKAPRVNPIQDKQAFLAQAGQDFPRLDLNFDIVGLATEKVNGFGDALGLSRWVNPEPGTPDNPLAGMDRLFEQYRYQRIADLDLSVQPGIEKIVVFVTVNPDGTVKDVTAAAHQEADGSWTAKIGKMAKIRIADPYQLQGPTYGLPFVIYAR
jgi:hypothetical protein